MRCKGCNVMMDNLSAKNHKTKEDEDLCPTCRDPQWDNGIIYKLNQYGHYTEEVETFVNESIELEAKEYQLSCSNSSDVSDLLLNIKEKGSVKVENT